MISTITQKVILYCILFSIVPIIVNIVLYKDSGMKENKDGESCIKLNGMATVFLVCGIIFTSIIIFAESQGANISGRTGLVVRVIVYGLVAMVYLLSFLLRLWYIKFGKDSITYRPLVGKKKELPYSMITHYETDDNGRIAVFHEKEKLYTFTDIVNKQEIIYILLAHNILERNPYQGEDIVLKPNGFYKGLMVVTTVVFIGAVLLCAYANIGFGVIFFGIFLIISFVSSLNQFYEKIILTKDSILHDRFMRRRKTIPFSKIKYLEFKKENNAEYYKVYSDKGMELKVSMLFKNASRFQDLVQKKNWKVQ